MIVENSIQETLIASSIERQRAFFYSNQTKDLNFRKAQLKKLRTAIKSYEPKVLEAIYQDFKKSEFEAYSTEFALLYQDIDEAISQLKSWAKTRSISSNLLNFPSKGYIIPEPLGVCLVIGAWNYPFQLSFAPIIAAIAAGNTVVLKPSELPAKTSEVIAEMVAKNFDPEFFTVVQGGIEETTELLSYKFDKIFFTGSVPVGKIVYQAAAKHLTPVTLELGGKSPAFVTADTDLKVTAKRLVWAKFLNAGQTCIAPDYILVEKSLEKSLIEALKEEIKRADYRFDNGNYVQIINQRNTERLLSMIDEEKVIFGGKYDVEQRFIEPTLMADVDFHDKIMSEEIFGPILPIISYDDLGQAISWVKERPKPLACYIFTNSSKVSDKILREVSFGGGAINDAIMHITNSKLPFGGVGESGIGNYHGEAGFRAFSHYKSVMKKPFKFEPDLKFSPYSDWKMKVARWLMG